jgi:hypothetical protein
MSYDFLGQFFGKVRRRKIEAAAQQVLLGGARPVAIDYGVLGTRLVVGATMALLNATLNHSLPGTAGGILTVAGIGLTGALPAGLKSSGLLTALSPNTLSAVQGLTQGLSSALAAPANKKKAAFQKSIQESIQATVATEVQAALNKTSMSGYTSAELGQKESSAQTAAPEATDGSTLAVGPETVIAAPASNAAIAQTGGNQ